MPRLPVSLIRAMVGALALTAGVLAGPACAQAAGPVGERRLTLFYTAEVHGVLEPCGCTSDPLGDVARYAELVRRASKQGPVALLDGGGLSYPESSTAKEKAPNQLRAKFLADTLPRLAPFAAGLAETDVRSGAEVVPQRLAVNLGAGAAIAPSRLETWGGIKVGVFGVADPALGATLGVKAEDPVAAGRREAERLRKAGAEIVVALAPIDRPAARRLAREAAVDLVVLGRQVGKGQERAERAGNGYLVAPADELQKVGRIDVVWRGSGPLVDAGGPEAAALRRVEIDKAVSRLDEELKSWAATGGGDAAFISARRAERESLLAERKSLEAPWKAPAGSYFTNQLIPVRRSLPRDAKIAAEMRRLDGQIAAINVKNAAPPPPAEPGRPYYVGDAKCASCHKAALAFWKKTVHASAWKTLVEVGKQDDYKCVSCHVTGYGQVGGSSLGHTDRLRNVQCEVCHGPGSAHVAAEGLEEPLALSVATPVSTCTTCHTEQHSDTFQYEAYLRDILGPGHAPAARKKLGDGPTGHTLRTNALARAKQAGKAQVGNL
jgi:cytochrome c554/c'-like protein